MNDELKIKNNELGGKMNYRYRTDDEMKDSGVEWIGKIPKEWINNKISREFEIIGSGSTPLSSNLEYYNGDINWLLTGDLTDGYIYQTSKKITQKALKDYSTLNIYPEESLIIAMYGATIGKTGLTKIKTTTNQACCVLANPKNLNIKFAHYWFIANKNEIVNLGRGGGQPNISQDLIKSLKFSNPLKSEQDNIVKFLFDSIISKKEALIEKLEEAKKSLISEVVTGKVKVIKTNDGYELVERKKEEMKDSGVEWLGDVYSDWCIMSIKRLSRIGRGASPRPIDNPDYFSDDGEYAWTRIADVSATGKYLLKTTQRTSKLGASLSVKLEPNKLFLSIAGSVGKPCITAIKACIHDGFVYFPDLKEFYTDYLYYIFEGGQCYKGLGKLGTQLNLNRETVGDIKIAVPNSKDEIVEINNFLQHSKN